MRSSRRTWNTPEPPQPSSGLTIISPPMASRNAQQPRGLARHQALGNQVGKVERVELLVRLAQPARRVHDQRHRRVHQAEEMRGEEERQVERRVLAHEDRRRRRRAGRCAPRAGGSGRRRAPPSTRRATACGTVRSTNRSCGPQWYCSCPRRCPSSWNAKVVSLSTSTRLIGIHHVQDAKRRHRRED